MSKANRENQQLQNDLGRLSILLTCLVRREGRVLLSDQEMQEAAQLYEGVKTSNTERGFMLEVVKRAEPAKDAPAAPVLELRRR